MTEVINHLVKTCLQWWTFAHEYAMDRHAELAAKAFSKTLDNWGALVNSANSYKSWRAIAESLFADGQFERGRLAIYKTYTNDVVASLEKKGHHREVLRINAEKYTLVALLKQSE